MSENVFQATWIRLRVLARMIRPFRRAYARLVVCFLLAPLIESGGVSLMIPLFGRMLAPSAGSFALPAALEAALRPLAALPLGTVCLLFVALAVARCAAAWFTAAQNERLSHLVREYWINRIFENLARADYAAVAGEPGGRLTNQIIQETDAGRTALIRLMSLFSSAVAILIYFVFLMLLSWRATLVFAALAAFVVGAIGRLSIGRLLGMGRDRVEAGRQVTQTIMEGLRGLREIKAFSLEGWVAGRLRGHLRRFTRSMSRYAALSQAPAHLQELFVVVAFVAGVYALSRIQGGDVAAWFPTIVAFTYLALRLTRLLDQALTTQFTVLYNLPALRSVQAELEGDRARRRQSGERPIARIETPVVFERVSFSYGDAPALEAVDLAIPPRGVTALVGPSGGGKSTLADLLLRLHDPTAGRIVVNGADLREFDPAAWRGRIGFVAQHGFLFSGSIRENIAMGRPDATDEEIEQAARRANAWEFIEPLERGLDTTIGEEGYGLSGGQRQRVRIARALAREPDLLILDEATSALDAKSERLIRDAVRSFARDKAAVVIAHRLAAIREADRIVLLEGGRVRAVGAFEELERGDALFRSLVEADGRAADTPPATDEPAVETSPEEPAQPE